MDVVEQKTALSEPGDFSLRLRSVELNAVGPFKSSALTHIPHERDQLLLQQQATLLKKKNRRLRRLYKTAQEFVDTTGGSPVWRDLLGARSVAREHLPEADHTFTRPEDSAMVAELTAAGAYSPEVPT